MNKNHLPESIDSRPLWLWKIGRAAAAVAIVGGVSLGTEACGGGSGSSSSGGTASPTPVAVKASTLPRAADVSVRLPHCHDFKGNSSAKTTTGGDLEKLLATALDLKGQPAGTDTITGTALCDPSAGKSNAYQVHEDDPFGGTNYGGDACAVVGPYAKDPLRSVVICVNSTALQ